MTIFAETSQRPTCEDRIAIWCLQLLMLKSLLAAGVDFWLLLVAGCRLLASQAARPDQLAAMYIIFRIEINLF